MPDLVIKDIDDDLLQRLRRRAEAAGRSVETESREILEQAARPTLAESLERADYWREVTAGWDVPDCVELIREDRNR